MVLFNGRAPAIQPKGKGKGKSKTMVAPALAKAAAVKKPAGAATPATSWSTLSSLPRTIRTRMMARSAGRLVYKADKPDSRAPWSIAPWLGGAAATAAAALACARAKLGGTGSGVGAEQPGRYMDNAGNMLLQPSSGGDADIFEAVKELQAEEQRAAMRSAEKRLPAMAEQRKAAAAAVRRAPGKERPSSDRQAQRRQNHRVFQPRHNNS